MEQTLVLIKPDSVQRGLVGEILRRFERKGLKLVAMKMVKLKDAVLKEHYAHVVDEPFFADLSHFMSSSPLVAMVLEAPNAVEIVRKIAGDKYELGSVRGDFAGSFQLDGPRNVIHSSDSIETAEREIDRFFDESEIFDYDKNEWKHIFKG